MSVCTYTNTFLEYLEVEFFVYGMHIFKSTYIKMEFKGIIPIVYIFVNT